MHPPRRGVWPEQSRVTRRAGQVDAVAVGIAEQRLHLGLHCGLHLGLYPTLDRAAEIAHRPDLV